MAPSRNGKRLELFSKHGLKHSIGVCPSTRAPCCITASVGFYTILPLTRNCLDSQCDTSIRGITLPSRIVRVRNLQRDTFHKRNWSNPSVVYFCLMPECVYEYMFVDNLCPECNASYHSNYCVHEVRYRCSDFLKQMQVLLLFFSLVLTVVDVLPRNEHSFPSR